MLLNRGRFTSVDPVFGPVRSVGGDGEKRCPCRHILLQLRGIDLVERVIGCVVNIEITAEILPQQDCGGS